MKKKVTAVVVTWNASELLGDLEKTLEGIRDRCEMIISDNASTDSSRSIIRDRMPWVRLIENGGNHGFGYGNNRAIEAAETPYVLLLNSDARISSDDLSILIEILESDDGLAAVQPLIRLWDWPMVTLSAGIAMTECGRGYDMDFMHFQPLPHTTTETVPGVTAAVSLFRREALQQVCGFDERFFMYFEDVDLCLRLRERGWNFAVAGEAEAFHRMGASSSRRSAEEWELFSSVLMARKFLGGAECRLSRTWKREERRSRLSLVKRLKSPLWRMKTVRKACSVELTHVDLDPDELQDMIRPRPMRFPGFRETGMHPHDDMPEGVTPGPGWIGGITGMNGFGCIRLPEEGAGLCFSVRSRNCAGSVGLWDDHGLIERNFVSSGAGTRFDVSVGAGSGRLYLVPDRQEMTVEMYEIDIAF